ncbi:hypothetical protein ZWY2020_009235 [Hordeum vulgare]|nr:hypothetical protein ZWY2020_009235 [Hordeum vulgare]
MSPAIPVIAVLTSDCRVFVSTRRQGGEINSCLVLSELSIVDIALFQGKIYGVSPDEELLGFELGNGRLRKPTPAGVKPDVVSGVTQIEGARAQNSMGSRQLHTLQDSEKISRQRGPAVPRRVE